MLFGTWTMFWLYNDSLACDKLNTEVALLQPLFGGQAVHGCTVSCHAVQHLHLVLGFKCAASDMVLLRPGQSFLYSSGLGFASEEADIDECSQTQGV